MLPEPSTLKKIFELMPNMNKTFFGAFFKEYPFEETMNKTHIKTLMTLLYCGPTPMSSISKKLNMEKGSFTPVAKKLQKMGLIEKIVSEEDRRVNLLSLTTEGSDYASDLRDKHHTFMTEQIEKLSTKEKNDFEKALDTIQHTLAQINERQ